MLKKIPWSFWHFSGTHPFDHLDTRLHVSDGWQSLSWTQGLGRHILVNDLNTARFNYQLKYTKTYNLATFVGGELILPFDIHTLMRKRTITIILAWVWPTSPFVAMLLALPAWPKTYIFPYVEGSFYTEMNMYIYLYVVYCSNYHYEIYILCSILSKFSTSMGWQYARFRLYHRVLASSTRIYVRAICLAI